MCHGQLCVMVNPVFVVNRVSWLTVRHGQSTACHGQSCVMVNQPRVMVNRVSWSINRVSWSTLCHGQSTVCHGQLCVMGNRVSWSTACLLFAAGGADPAATGAALPALHAAGLPATVATPAAAVPANTGNSHGRHCQYETLYHTALQAGPPAVVASPAKI